MNPLIQSFVREDLPLSPSPSDIRGVRNPAVYCNRLYLVKRGITRGVVQGASPVWMLMYPAEGAIYANQGKISGRLRAIQPP